MVARPGLVLLPLCGGSGPAANSLSAGMVGLLPWQLGTPGMTTPGMTVLGEEGEADKPV